MFSGAHSTKAKAQAIRVSQMNVHLKSTEFNGLIHVLDDAIQQHPDKRSTDDKLQNWGQVGRLLIDELAAADERGETIQSVPAFLEAELRRRFSGAYSLHPRRIDTNDRYRDLTKELIKLSTGSLIPSNILPAEYCSSPVGSSNSRGP
jgi:hypothetical protein